MTDKSDNLPEIPDAVVAPKKRWSISAVWLIPAVAALIGGGLAVKAILDKGPTITISFKTAESLEAGKTKIKYRDVDVGQITNIVLAPDRKSVIATVELVKGSENALVEDTRFWVSRARITGGGVSGLGTLLSGAYIGLDIGTSTKRRHDFIGLDEPPPVASDVPGHEYVLKSEDLGSLDAGSPVFFRRMAVGQVMSHQLDKDGRGVTVKIFVNAPFDKYVTTNTRFWNASGIDVKVDSNGLSVNTQSLTSIMVGGIAFETPLTTRDMPAAESDATFVMYDSRSDAMKNPESRVMPAVMVFSESVRGLTVGAPIDFRGIVIGEVTGIHVNVDPVSKEIVMPVSVNLYPNRLAERAMISVTEARKMMAAPGISGAEFPVIIGMVERGMRGQLRTGNLLTGQLYISLDFYPNMKKIRLDTSKTPIELPTTPSSQRELQQTLANIAQKIDKFPLEDIGTDLRQTLQSSNKLVQRLDTEVTPEAAAALAEARKALANADKALNSNSQLQQDAQVAMREMARAAESFRVLADYLERHPEALLRGKQEEQK